MSECNECETPPVVTIRIAPLAPGSYGAEGPACLEHVDEVAEKLLRVWRVMNGLVPEHELSVEELDSRAVIQERIG